MIVARQKLNGPYV